MLESRNTFYSLSSSVENKLNISWRDTNFSPVFSVMFPTLVATFHYITFHYNIIIFPYNGLITCQSSKTVRYANAITNHHSRYILLICTHKKSYTHTSLSSNLSMCVSMATLYNVKESFSSYRTVTRRARLVNQEF